MWSWLLSLISQFGVKHLIIFILTAAGLLGGVKHLDSLQDIRESHAEQRGTIKTLKRELDYSRDLVKNREKEISELNNLITIQKRKTDEVATRWAEVRSKLNALSSQEVDTWRSTPVPNDIINGMLNLQPRGLE